MFTDLKVPEALKIEPQQVQKSLKDQFWEDSLHLYFAVYMYPTDVKTAKPIWPKF